MTGFCMHDVRLDMREIAKMPEWKVKEGKGDTQKGALSRGMSSKSSGKYEMP